MSSTVISLRDQHRSPSSLYFDWAAVFFLRVAIKIVSFMRTMWTGCLILLVDVFTSTKLGDSRIKWRLEWYGSIFYSILMADQISMVGVLYNIFHEILSELKF